MAGFYCESLPALSEPARRRVRFSAGRCFLGYQGSGHAEAHAPICQRIAFALQQDGIYVIDNNGSGLRRIWSQGNTMYPVDWSPDGSKFAFMACCGTDKGIFVMDSNGSDVTRLIGHEFAGEGCGDVLNICGVYSPTWSPDGHRLRLLTGRAM